VGKYYRTRNFHDRHKGNVTEEDGRVFLFGYREVGPIMIEDRFHFYEKELGPEAWERVRKRHRLPKKMRHTCRSYGVRRGEGRRYGGPWVSPMFDVGIIYAHNHFGTH
jgi:hypothetical protein